MTKNEKNEGNEGKFCFKCRIALLTFLTIWVLGGFAARNMYEFAQSNRYAVVGGGGVPVMLLDQKSGLVWKNVECQKGGPANCWQMMVFENNEPSFLSPRGMQHIRDKEIPKFLKQQQKLANSLKEKEKQKETPQSK